MEPTRTYGWHLLLDGYGANPEKLANVGILYAFLDALPAQLGMQKIGPPQLAQFHEPEIAGVTGIILITTSHISLHTYSHKDCFFMDIFACKAFDAGAMLDTVQTFFEATRLEHRLVERGRLFPVQNLHD
jgi:S-adenosylmethionine decarboxylase